MKFQKASLFAAIALALSAGANLAYPQSFVQVTTSSLVQIAAGGQSMWGLNQSGQIFQFDPGAQKFTQVPGQLTSIVVGGGTLGQLDEVWGLNGSHEIFRFNPQDLPAPGLFEQKPGFLSRISVGPGYEPCHQAEVWGINASGDIYRFNYCANTFFQVPGILAQIAVGDGEVWGLNAAGQIYRFNFQTGTFLQAPGILAGIVTGGGQVWGINSSFQIFRLDRATGAFTQVQVPGALLNLSVGGNGVWALNFSGSIYRFDESSQEFVQVNGVLATIAVGSGAGVWGLDADHVFVFRTP
jgi:virginiamycin B lyase